MECRSYAGPYDSGLFRDFRVWVDAVHTLAEKSPGFVWRLKGEETNVGYIQADPEDPLLMGNLSVWNSAEALYRFIFSGAHEEMMRNKRKWFEKMDEPYSVFWNQFAENPMPNAAHGRLRLALLRDRGDTKAAFGTRYLHRETVRE